MRRALFAWAAAVLFAWPSLAVPVIEGPVVDPGNGHTYYLLDTDTWTNSEAQAVTMGGTLATIRDAAENQWVFDTFRGPSGNRRDLWIGLRDPKTGDGTGAAHAANFVWVSGAPVTFTTWSTNEPNNDANNGGEYFGSLTGFAHNGQTPGTWNDKNNAAPVTPSYGVVEIVPEPMGFAIALGLLLTMTRAVGRKRYCLHF